MGGAAGGLWPMGLEGKGSGLSWHFETFFFPSPFWRPLLTFTDRNANERKQTRATADERLGLKTQTNADKRKIEELHPLFRTPFCGSPRIARFLRIVSGFPNWTSLLRIALRGLKIANRRFPPTSPQTWCGPDFDLLSTWFPRFQVRAKSQLGGK